MAASSTQWRTMARYNRWMNERLYAACARIPDPERRADRGAFFRSIHGTLNHLLLGDRLWLARFRGERFVFDALDDELCADFAELRRQRERTDTDVEAWVETLDEARLAAPMTFHSVVRDRDHTYPTWLLVAHFFNHQTHHRGQLTTLMMQAGVDPGVTDLLWLPGAEMAAPAGA